MKVKMMRKLAIVCLVLVLTGASWAGDCKKSKSGCTKGDNKKVCEKKDKKCEGEKKGCQKAEGEKKGCQKSESKKQCPKSSEKSA